MISSSSSSISSSSSLKLDYGVVPSPNPIRASASGANPNPIDFQVIISNPSTDPVVIGSIEIAIPVGEDIALDLSASPNLPLEEST